MSKEHNSKRSLKSRKEIVLVRDQEAHAQSLIEILKKSVVAFDMSMMGAGKTYVASEVAIRFDFKHIIVVCPASVMGKWESMKKFLDSPIQIMSYEALRSTTPKLMSSESSGKRLLSHGLLYRIDPNPFKSLESITPKILKSLKDSKTSESLESLNPSSTSFFPSEKLVSIIKEGCLFIFDEAQKVKNKNASWLATKTISETILGRSPLGVSTFGPKSRLLMLSGTPIDKEEHAVNLMEMMGFIQSRKLFIDRRSGMSPKDLKSNKNILPGLPKISNKNVSDVKLIGAQELIDFCKNINKEKTERIVRIL